MRYAVLLLAAVLTWAGESVPAPSHDEVIIANERIRVAISTLRASVRRIELLESHPIRLPKPLATQVGTLPDGSLPVLRAFMPEGNHNWLWSANGGLDDRPWTIERRSDDAVTLSFQAANGLTWTVSYALAPQALAVRVDTDVHNGSAVATPLEVKLFPLTGIHTDYAPGEAYYQAVFTHDGGASGGIHNHGMPEIPTREHPNAAELKLGGGAEGVDFVGLKSRFFAAWWTPTASASASGETAAPAAAGLDGMAQGAPSLQAAPAADWVASARGFNGTGKSHQALILVSYPTVQLEPGQHWHRSWTLTTASMTKGDLAAVSAMEQQVRYTDGYYRFFKILANALTWVLDKLALVVGHYGVAIILLTVLIKAALYRFTFKQQESMLKMQKVAPELKYLQEQYKNNKQMLAQKQMELWKKHGVNPLGGCLPMFIQLPIFIALYQAFSHSADLRGTSFLWVPDLTLPDPVWGVAIPFLNNWVLSLNPLPLLYIGVSAWMGFSQPPPTNNDPQQQMMYKMMRWMPVIFGVIFYNFPSGLVLYFTVQAVISTLELKYIRRKLGMG